MAQLSLYIDDLTMERLRARAEEGRRSLSAYVVDLVRCDLEEEWPPGLFELYGCMRDSEVEVPEELSWDLDAPRPWDSSDSAE